MSTQPIIRHPMASDGEGLEALWPHLAHFRWNPEQVYVAELDGQLVGGALIWDGGHDVVHLDELTVREGFRRQGVGTLLMVTIGEEFRRRGKRAILGWTKEGWFEQIIQRFGGYTEGSVTMCWWML